MTQRIEGTVTDRQIVQSVASNYTRYIVDGILELRDYGGAHRIKEPRPKVNQRAVFMVDPTPGGTYTVQSIRVL